MSSNESIDGTLDRLTEFAGSLPRGGPQDRRSFQWLLVARGGAATFLDSFSSASATDGVLCSTSHMTQWSRALPFGQSGRFRRSLVSLTTLALRVWSDTIELLSITQHENGFRHVESRRVVVTSASLEAAAGTHWTSGRIREPSGDGGLSVVQERQVACLS